MYKRPKTLFGVLELAPSEQDRVKSLIRFAEKALSLLLEGQTISDAPADVLSAGDLEITDDGFIREAPSYAAIGVVNDHADEQEIRRLSGLMEMLHGITDAVNNGSVFTKADLAAIRPF